MPDENQIRGILESAGLIEDLAAIEHERWAEWQIYVHAHCTPSDDGGLTIPPHLVARWTQQIQTKYQALSEEEKASDRDQVERYLPRILEALTNTELDR